MKVYLACPEARPLWSYIVQEFGYEFSDKVQDCDILVCPDQGRSREEGVALDQLLRSLHWRSSKAKQLLWKKSSGAPPPPQPNTPFVKLTKLPGMSDICEKVRFHRLLQVVKVFFDKEKLDLCVPDTYILPEQAPALRRDCRSAGSNGGLRQTLIIKPEYGTQGAGIFLCRTAQDLNQHLEKFRVGSSNMRKSVAQVYVENPLLLDGYKFDFRLYVVITEIVPHMKALLYKEGLARFCTTRYKGAGHMDDRTKSESSHLTNYSIARKSSLFKEGRTKRLLSLTLQQMAKKYPERFSVEKFWKDMELLTKKMMLAMSPTLLAELIRVKKLSNPDVLNFSQDVTFNHVLGVDVILDDNMKPWLLEVNATPSLSIEKVVASELRDQVARGAGPPPAVPRPFLCESVEATLDSRDPEEPKGQEEEQETYGDMLGQLDQHVLDQHKRSSDRKDFVQTPAPHSRTSTANRTRTVGGPSLVSRTTSSSTTSDTSATKNNSCCPSTTCATSSASRRLSESPTKNRTSPSPGKAMRIVNMKNPSTPLSRPGRNSSLSLAARNYISSGSSGSGSSATSSTAAAPEDSAEQVHSQRKSTVLAQQVAEQKQSAEKQVAEKKNTILRSPTSPTSLPRTAVFANPNTPPRSPTGATLEPRNDASPMLFYNDASPSRVSTPSPNKELLFSMGGGVSPTPSNNAEPANNYTGDASAGTTAAASGTGAGSSSFSTPTSRTTASSMALTDYEKSQSRSYISDIFRNRTTNPKRRRIFGGAVCTCDDFNSRPHHHIESEVDIRAKYGPIKTLLTDFSKTIHDPSSCFFMPNSAVLANSVVQSLCLGVRKDVMPPMENNDGGGSSHPNASNGVSSPSSSPRTAGKNSPRRSSLGHGTQHSPIIRVNRRGEVMLESTDGGTTSPLTAKKNGDNVQQQQQTGGSATAKGSTSTNSSTGGAADRNKKTTSSQKGSATSSGTSSDAGSTAMPHINLKGVCLRLNAFPNFNERHLQELRRILQDNEAFRSNQTSEPCQCPIILDVCNRNAPYAASFLKLYRLFRKTAELYVEMMINCRADQGVASALSSHAALVGRDVDTANQDYETPGSSTGTSSTSTTGAEQNNLTLSSAQSRIATMVRSEPKLFFKHHQMTVDSMLRSLEKLQKQLIESTTFLVPFPSLATSGSRSSGAASTNGGKNNSSSSASERGGTAPNGCATSSGTAAAVRSPTIKKLLDRLSNRNTSASSSSASTSAGSSSETGGGSSSNKQIHMFYGEPNTPTSAGGSTLNLVNYGFNGGNNASGGSSGASNSRSSTSSSAGVSTTSGSYQNAIADMPSHLQLPKKRTSEDTLGGGIVMLLVGLSALAQGGHSYYEDYDLALGVLGIISRIKTNGRPPQG
ncbi:unnamed protein product [Amoebophrya sp. A25]|nr:unnamed protein product [Amoebophrya sp. A25]|eukprot:GSA25T00021204001.1